MLGSIEGADVGGVEIISYDAAAGSYRSEFFDSMGNLSTSRPTADGDVWSWTGERTRCTATFSDDGRTQTASHELCEDGGWQPSMQVTLHRIG